MHSFRDALYGGLRVISKAVPRTRFVHLVMMATLLGTTSCEETSAVEGVSVGDAEVQKVQNDAAQSEVIGYFDTPLELSGFFRPDAVIFHPSKTILVPGDPPWLPVPAESGSQPVSTTLPPEAWVDTVQLKTVVESLMADGVKRNDVLSAAMDISAEGRFEVSWVGASEGKMAMRAGRKEKGVRASYYAVESASEEPLEFVIAGLPAPAQGSLEIEYSDFVDEHVALRCTVTPLDEGVIMVVLGADGTMALFPGSRSAL